MTETLFESSAVPRAAGMLERATWAGKAYAQYDKASVDRIVAAVVEAAEAKATEYAEWAVRETGFGVVEHKVLKNQACSRGLLDTYRDHDYVTPRIDNAAKIVSTPRPAGVILALTPSTNPVASVYFKTILALMTRNAIVISPHPFAKECCSDAARLLSQAAVGAGAPDGLIQVVEEPSIPLINVLMSDERTSVIVATGGTAVVSAAYHSGHPALGVGPANVPILVDHTADLARAAQRIVDSKSFDNSILCTNESVLIVEESCREKLVRHLKQAGAYLLSDEERDRVRALLFPDGSLAVRTVGKHASWIAEEAGVRVGPNTRILLAPFDLVVPEETLAHEKLCPVLGLVSVPNVEQGIQAARALLRITGGGHSAVIHSTDPATIMSYSTQIPVYRVVVNVGNSLGSSGITTNLAPTMTVGTGFFGGSSLGENLEPKHLVNWTRIAYNSDASEPFGDFTSLSPWKAPVGHVPPYPHPSNAAPVPSVSAVAPAPIPGEPGELREELRRLIIEELQQIIKG